MFLLNKLTKDEKLFLRTLFDDYLNTERESLLNIVEMSPEEKPTIEREFYSILIRLEKLRKKLGI